MEVAIIFPRFGGCMSKFPLKIMLVIRTIGGRWKGAGPMTLKGLDFVLRILVKRTERGIERGKGPVGPAEKP